MRRTNWQRPPTLAAVVEWAATPDDLGPNFDDFLDHLNWLVKQRASRQKLLGALRREPPPSGDAAMDAYLAATAAHLAALHGLRPPRWVDGKSRRLARPWFAVPDAWARAWLLRDSPPAFRERNLFTEESPLRRA